MGGKDTIIRNQKKVILELEEFLVNAKTQQQNVEEALSKFAVQVAKLEDTISNMQCNQLKLFTVLKSHQQEWRRSYMEKITQLVQENEAEQKRYCRGNKDVVLIVSKFKRSVSGSSNVLIP